MIFYQQSAVADKGLHPEDYPSARWDTAIGAVITQSIMAAVLIATAATIGIRNPHAPLNTVQQIARAFMPYLGDLWGKIVFSVGIVGAGMIAAIVASLAGAWGWGEVTGFKHSLEHHPREAPWFYGTYTVIILAGALAVALIPNLVTLDIAVEVMNAFLLPLVLGFLVALSVRALPKAHRIRGRYFWLVAGVSTISAGLGVYGGRDQHTRRILVLLAARKKCAFRRPWAPPKSVHFGHRHIMLRRSGWVSFGVSEHHDGGAGRPHANCTL
jgi:Mn2+/Fe2+ NRAMP family transporter